MFFKLKKHPLPPKKQTIKQKKLGSNNEFSIQREVSTKSLIVTEHKLPKTQFSRQLQAFFQFDNHHHLKSIYKQIHACFLKNTEQFVVPNGFFAVFQQILTSRKLFFCKVYSITNHILWFQTCFFPLDRFIVAAI